MGGRRGVGYIVHKQHALHCARWIDVDVGKARVGQLKEPVRPDFAPQTGPRGPPAGALPTSSARPIPSTARRESAPARPASALAHCAPGAPWRRNPGCRPERLRAVQSIATARRLRGGDTWRWVAPGAQPRRPARSPDLFARHCAAHHHSAHRTCTAHRQPTQHLRPTGARVWWWGCAAGAEVFTPDYLAAA